MKRKLWAAGMALALLLLIACGGPAPEEPVLPEETETAELASAGEAPAPVPLEPPEEPPAAPPLSQAERILREMTLREKVYQLFMVFPSQLPEFQPENPGPALQSAPVGGLILDRSDMVSREQTVALTQSVQSHSKISLLLACDEEGGKVRRLPADAGNGSLASMLSYEAEGAARARENARYTAEALLRCGLNMDLAPVADVWSNPANQVIGSRAYSREFGTAAELVGAAVEGFHEGGAICTLKHFPGHGDTSADSHAGAVYVEKTVDALRAAELVPFAAGIEAGADCVMLGHLIVRDADEQPAPFSPVIIRELLREELGFTGVVMTDSLQMKAMTDAYSPGEIAERAVSAGADLLLCPPDLEKAAQALLDAAEAGRLSEGRIDESVLRILALKERYGLLDALPEEP